MKNFAQQYNDIARAYLKNYFLLLPKFYGQESHVLNAHYLLYLADDVCQNYTFNDISAFPFENQLGLIKKLIHTANKPLAQICRRIHEKNIINKKAIVPPVLSIVKQKKILENCQLLKLQYRNFSITAKQPTNVFMLNNDTIIQIVSLGYYCTSENDVKITGVC